MSGQMFTFRAIALSVAVSVCSWVSSAHAISLDSEVAFTSVNQNPWTGGAAFNRQFDYNELHKNFNVTIPPISGDTVGLIADFLGVDLPSVLSVTAGANVSGNAGFDFGYYVSGGRLNLDYPGRATLDIATSPDDKLVIGKSTAVASTFDPGLVSRFVPLFTSAVPIMAGAGYDESLRGINMYTFQDPTFATSFPNAAGLGRLQLRHQRRRIGHRPARVPSRAHRMPGRQDQGRHVW